MVRLHVERVIAAMPERVFDWLDDPANLVTAPMILRAGWAADSVEPGAGAVREAVGTGVWLREQITEYDRPHRYSYLIVRSFPAFGHEGGTVTLSAATGGTHVDWVSSYSHPLRAGGAALNVITARLLPWNFEAILAACARALER
ncbi:MULTISPECIES: SRPBCC family protein [Mycobacteriaceae]|uniref:Polyketide cyclase n=1 Tax=Mycolicibacterium neoaurum VKM Ac-1815D TaxID=700508 RepID=V5XHZ5_MYCNE|nr:MULTISPECIES: SRPBCC family protein [Mycobacteriaceae]AHC27473.1 polyketide cyclase [Mycolicibacterium neoaurum VKM Ac-1815D]AMO07683.1 polyketide cyclase [Mycolicibacterium neoaurum]AXK73930.1 SRPBCC family protein [Mycolicibacterium neoaurum]KJQ51635.1 polyketide cyclase [Mycolicibacterium neoaurum]KUM08787.1 polyketide cyclase [Mycolicibacterium neoaurum]